MRNYLIKESDNPNAKWLKMEHMCRGMDSIIGKPQKRKAIIKIKPLLSVKTMLQKKPSLEKKKEPVEEKTVQPIEQTRVHFRMDQLIDPVFSELANEPSSNEICHSLIMEIFEETMFKVRM